MRASTEEALSPEGDEASSVLNMRQSSQSLN
jgi:hypothetical protein